MASKKRAARKRVSRKAKAKIAAIAGARETLDMRWAEKNKRITRLAELLESPRSQVEIVEMVAKEFGVAERTVYDDKRELEARIHELAVQDTILLTQRAAAKWNRRERMADERGDSNAGNYALDRWCRVFGAYAPKKLELSGTVGVAIEIRAVMAVLDAEGLAAFEIVLGKLEAAKAAGKLPAPGAPPAIESAPPKP
jgi:hypothetical protein